MKPARGYMAELADSRARVRPIVIGKERDPKRMTRQNARINLKLVAEVLSEKGLDPTVELVKIIQEDKLEPEVRARLLNELLQYTQPKLKSVEVRAKVVATSFDLSNDQAKKLAEEFLISQGGALDLIEAAK